MIRFTNWFVKLTGFPADLFVFRTKIFYENKKKQGRNIKGPAIIICNHTSVFDYACLLFVFFTRTIRAQMAEVLFEEKPKPLGIFLKMMGGIYVNRNSHDFGFLVKSERILQKKGVVLVFPEARIPLPEEERPLEFRTSAAFLALSSGVPVIPVCTDGNYFGKGRARVLIGESFYAADFASDDVSEKENIRTVTEKMRNKIIALGEMLENE